MSRAIPSRRQTPPARQLLALVLAAALMFLPSSAHGFMGSLTVEKERQIGEEFFLELQHVFNLIQDPFLNSYLNRIGQRLVAQLGSQPFPYRFYILEDPSMNAFAVPGGYIFVTTGFIRSMEREGELAGVLAHEISHIYARHLSRQLDKSKVVNVASVLGALAGVFLGVPALAQGLMVGSMAAGEGMMLKYSREMESEADSLGFKWMVKAGYDPRDMIAVFKKMGRQRWFEGGKIPIYLSTHPEADSRMVDLAHQMSNIPNPAPTAPGNPDFQYFTVKLESLSGNPALLLRRVTRDQARDPKNPVFCYGKALALAKLDRPEEAVAAFHQAQALAPDNFLIKRDLGIQYFDRNRYPEALQILEGLYQRYPQDEAVLYYLGRIYQERHQTDRALALMEKVHTKNPAFVEVYYNLGTLYGAKGNLGLAHYYLGYHSLKAKAYPTALFHFKKALANLSPGDARYSEVRRQIARLEKMRVRVVN